MCQSDIRSNQAAALLKRKSTSVMAATMAALLLGACANGPKIGDSFLMAEAKNEEKADPNKQPQSELEKALEYWGKEHAKSPRDVKAAVSYAKNLKAAGQKDQALVVLQNVSIFNGGNRELASEYGRLALDAGQAGLAQKLLEVADDPAKPDWKIVSARGTALAKQGQFKQAIPLYERALLLSPNQPSVVSNLAMAHAANGEAPRAEALLRTVAETPNSDPKVRQNLALVLGLQGKYDEARVVSAKDIPAENAASNVEYVRQMVRMPEQGNKMPAGKDAGSVQSAVIKRGGADAYTPLRGGAGDAPAADSAWSTSVTASITPSAPKTSSSNGLKPSAR